MIIDAHTHIFSSDLNKYPLAAPKSTYRPITDGRAELLYSQMVEAGVDRAVTISPWFYGWDIRYTLDTLQEHRSWLAVVALVDPTSMDGPQQLEHYVNEYGVCGLRIQGKISRLGRFDDPRATPLWQKAADLGLPIDINATHEEYSQVERRIRQFPQIPVILDHCGYISSDLAPSSPTVEPVLRLAQYPNVYAKLTFLGIPSQKPYPFTDVHWMARVIIDTFGAERCLNGSNFPTAQYNPLMTYRQTVQLFSEEIELTSAERSWILGGTAAKLWIWQE
jgi:L-fuconolactonase